MMRPLTATYRMQLRNGLDFDGARAFLPLVERIGISHLYLSPIFAAQTGSTHGYDIIDPNLVEPSLGGEAGFEALCQAAAARGIGVIIDIVPNHMAFSAENTWLRDVMRNGVSSAYADHFDIDYDQPLLLPFLEQPFEAYLDAGQVQSGMEEDGPVLIVGPHAIPAAGPAPAADAGMAKLAAYHEAQPWRLTPWHLERDSVTHRRFFNVTGLIGMRVEEQSVFDAMHRKVVEFARAGLIHGVRVDHVDGLVDPGGYLERLRDALGVAPIWIEKILTRDETLPDWPVVGTTGYEAARKLTQLLTDGLGQAQIVEDWRTATGRDESFHDVLMAAKAEVMQNELAAELHQLIALSEAALEAEGALHGPEAVREAVLALLSAVPRYRTYFLGRQGSDEDRALFDAVRVEAGETVRIPATIDAIHSLIADPTNANAVALQARFQQVTGALLAKAHEDTAGFRWNAYLASNEVGAEPDEATITVEGFGAWLSTQGALGLTLTSSHDTKRSEDARMRLAAISHLPEAFGTLWLGAQALPEAEAADANMCWFAVQSALAIWQPDAPDTADRLTDHLSKAVREGKELSNWTVPDLEAEAALHAFAAALVRDWQRETPGALNALVARGARLSLVQTALKMVMPGVPDIYGEAVGEHLALTDPDNRRPVTPEALDGLAKAPGFTGQKARLTEQLLAMRLAYPGFFSAANCACEEVDGVVTLRRSFEGADLVLTFRRDGGDLSPEVAWRDDVSAVPLPVGVRWGETG